MTSPPVLAAGTWPTNADLIADVAQLYITEDARVLDATYGEGKWWTKWRPAALITNDFYKPADYAYDFRRLPFPRDTFDAVAYDPPYVAMGGRETSTIRGMVEAYGMAHAPATPRRLHDELVLLGLLECSRVTLPKGVILAKCQDYISSGRLQPATHWLLTDALAAGLELVDRFEHVTGIRPQPPGRRQVHARRNLSTLFVFTKPKGWSKQRAMFEEAT